MDVQAVIQWLALLPSASPDTGSLVYHLPKKLCSSHHYVNFLSTIRHPPDLNCKGPTTAAPWEQRHIQNVSTPDVSVS